MEKLSKLTRFLKSAYGLRLLFGVLSYLLLFGQEFVLSSDGSAELLSILVFSSNVSLIGFLGGAQLFKIGIYRSFDDVITSILVSISVISFAVFLSSFLSGLDVLVLLSVWTLSVSNVSLTIVGHYLRQRRRFSSFVVLSSLSSLLYTALYLCGIGPIIIISVLSLIFLYVMIRISTINRWKSFSFGRLNVGSRFKLSSIQGVVAFLLVFYLADLNESYDGATVAKVLFWYRLFQLSGTLQSFIDIKIWNKREAIGEKFKLMLLSHFFLFVLLTSFLLAYKGWIGILDFGVLCLGILLSYLNNISLYIPYKAYCIVMMLVVISFMGFVWGIYQETVSILLALSVVRYSQIYALYDNRDRHI